MQVTGNVVCVGYDVNEILGANPRAESAFLCQCGTPSMVAVTGRSDVRA